jgi:hypothetical protein
MADKQKMPVDGSGTEKRDPDDNGELASRRDADSGGLPNVGESGGGAYANPHSEKEEEGGFHGGQSTRGYYGKGQLGDKDVDDTDNSVAKER